eukprot:gnl/Ergobibamus_cyprinoides/1610.p1 GENE.gnl/Ergobibamus_cyprinoides/1610~~gnl/Ergobibamus_cyprinoides/1610.p1  ORF type:complete len:148 (-),score=67.61 gnl/Ergobibamus_cyprinoides/1610:326-769(-)
MIHILIDWVIEVCDDYQLTTQAPYLAVSLIHRFLSKNRVARKKLQLVAVTCVFIASKYEDCCPPSVVDYALITDNTYEVREILEAESLILNSEKFALTVSTPRSFLRRFLKAANASTHTSLLVYFLCEISLRDVAFLTFRRLARTAH